MNKLTVILFVWITRTSLAQYENPLNDNFNFEPPTNEFSSIFNGIGISTNYIADNQQNESYEKTRLAIMEEEKQMRTGDNLVLIDNELLVHQMLKHQKLAELSQAYRKNDQNPTSMHFFKAKPLIEKSKIFKFIQGMPKGAVLHIHNVGSVSSPWVVANLTYMDGIYKCLNREGLLLMTFRKSGSQQKCITKYDDIQKERKKSNGNKKFDKFLEQKINLFSSIPEVEYNSDQKIWKRFRNMFATIEEVLKYVPAFKAYHWQMMKEMLEDNIMYAEVRLDVQPLYDYVSNVTLTSEDTLEILQDLVEEFSEINPSFIGLKVIYASNRNQNISSIRKDYEEFKKLHALFPNFLIGFDLIGYEDSGVTLHSLEDILKDKPETAKFFFHAGETNWYGASPDTNLVDAVLLNTSRIGHGFSLLKHPILLRTILEKDIAIEITPISNQVLNLLSDLRNHPGSYMMSTDIPLVISNDYPGFWNAKGVSYDLYYALMSLAANDAGLETLKALVWNSIKYSSLNEEEKDEAYQKLTLDWWDYMDHVAYSDIL